MLMFFLLYGTEYEFALDRLVLAAVVIGLTLYNGVSAGRNLPFRHLPLPKGQSEAAIAIGLARAR